MKTKTMALFTAVAGALALAACGSSSSSSTTSTTSSTSSSTTASAGDLTTFCADVKGLKSLDSTFQSLAPNDISGAKTAFQAADDALRKTADAAPTEIKSDADAVASAFDTLNSKIQGLNSPADIPGLAQTLKPTIAALQSHITSLQAYSQKNC